MTKRFASFLLAGLAATSLTALDAKPARACPAEPYIGAICAAPYARGCPVGYTLADGRLMTIQQNAALYSLLGTKFGGDGSSNFRLPDLRGRVPVGAGNATGPGPQPGQGQTSVVQLGQYRGQESVTLTPAQTGLAAHSHSATFTGTGGGSGQPAQASGTVNIPVTGSTAAQNVSVSGSLKIANTAGGGQQAPANGAILTKAGGGQGAVYATTGSADTTIGPAQTFTGSAPAVAVTGTAAGPVTLPVTGGGGGITGGTVAVQTASANPTAYTPTLPPELGVYYCIATDGLYPNFNN